MWKDGERAKKRQKTAGRPGGQLGGKAAAGAAVAVEEEAIKEEGEI